MAYILLFTGQEPETLPGASEGKGVMPGSGHSTWLQEGIEY